MPAESSTLTTSVIRRLLSHQHGLGLRYAPTEWWSRPQLRIDRRSETHASDLRPETSSGFVRPDTPPALTTAPRVIGARRPSPQTRRYERVYLGTGRLM